MPTRANNAHVERVRCVAARVLGQTGVRMRWAGAGWICQGVLWRGAGDVVPWGFGYGGVCG